MKKLFEARLKNELNNRQSSNLFRETTISNDNFLNLTTNDYFLLRKNSKILTFANNVAKKYGSGSGASPLLSGYLPCHEELIDTLLNWKNKNYGMLFNTGFMANQALIKHLPGENDLILIDKLSHHSMIQALNRRSVKFKRYKHLDMSHLEELLALNQNKFQTIFVMTESVFSMDGDYPDLKKIVKIKQKYPFILILDEAHGTGVLGNKGAGLAEEAGVQNEVDIIIGTFGKALAGMGAYVITNLSYVINYLTNFSGEYIYSTFLSPYHAGVALASIDIVMNSQHKRSQLKNTSKWLRNQLAKYINVETNLHTPIIPLIFNDIETVLKLQKLFLKKGIIVGAVRPPTVPNNSSRIRLTLNCELSKKELEPVIKTIKEWSSK